MVFALRTSVIVVVVVSSLMSRPRTGCMMPCLTNTETVPACTLCLFVVVRQQTLRAGVHHLITHYSVCEMREPVAAHCISLLRLSSLCFFSGGGLNARVFGAGVCPHVQTLGLCLDVNECSSTWSGPPRACRLGILTCLRVQTRRQANPRDSSCSSRCLLFCSHVAP